MAAAGVTWYVAFGLRSNRNQEDKCAGKSFATASPLSSNGYLYMTGYLHFSHHYSNANDDSGTVVKYGFVKGGGTSYRATDIGLIFIFMYFCICTYMPTP